MALLHACSSQIARDMSSTPPPATLGDGRSGPSELALRVHDLGELLTKVRSQLYKVDKRGSNTEAAVSELSKHQVALAERLHILEAAPTAQSGGSGGDSGMQVCNTCWKVVPYGFFVRQARCGLLGLCATPYRVEGLNSLCT